MKGKIHSKLKKNVSVKTLSLTALNTTNEILIAKTIYSQGHNNDINMINK